MADAKKSCLVIAPIGDPGTDIRRRSDDVLELVIRPALEPLGYAPQRADEISEPGNITSQVIQRLIDDPLVIADLTGRNPNVFYELAVRHATKQPLIQLIQRGESIPFDVAVMRTISVDLSARGAQEAIAAITEQAKAIDAKGGVEWNNPISGAIDFQALNQSKRPEDRSIATILEGIKEIRQMMRDQGVTIETVVEASRRNESEAKKPEPFFWRTDTMPDGSVRVHTPTGRIRLNLALSKVYKEYRDLGYAAETALGKAIQTHSEHSINESVGEAPPKIK